MGEDNERGNDKLIIEMMRGFGGRLEGITAEVAKISGLSEKVQGFLMLVETINNNIESGMRSTEKIVSDHETRLRVLEAVTKEREAATKQRDHWLESIWGRYLAPLAVIATMGVVALLGARFGSNHPATQVTLSTPAALPAPREAKPAE